MHLILALMAAVPLLAVLTACPSPPAGTEMRAPIGECVKIGAQCRLPDGVLGVCEHATPNDARLACMPQH